MADERFTTPRETSQPTSNPSMNQRQVYASQRAEILFGCYRRGDANDPERYVASIAAVLSVYDFELIREVTDPRTGICTSEKFMTFMPNVGELKAYCEAVATRKDRLKRLGDLPKPNFEQARLAPPESVAGDLAQVFVPDSHQRHASLVEWAKTANPRFWKFGKSSDGRPGIWVSWEVWEYRPTTARVQKDLEPRSLALSEVAKKVMRDIDAERDGNFPIDKDAAE